jgi:hypothetical protein
MLFAHALETRGPAIACSWRDTATALIALAFEVTDAIGAFAPRRGVSWHLARRRAVASYDTYLRARGLDAEGVGIGADLGLSATIRFRERDADIAFLGARCTSCGQVHFPKQRVCAKCFAKDGWERTACPTAAAGCSPTRSTTSSRRGAAHDHGDDRGRRLPRAGADDEHGRGDQASSSRSSTCSARSTTAGGKPNYFWKASPTNG